MTKPSQINRRMLVRYLLKAVALGGIATVAVVWFTVSKETWQQMSVFNWAWVPVLLALVVIAWICNGARVWVLSRSLGYPLRFQQALAVSLSSEFGIAATPAGVGGTVIRLTLLKRAGVPLTKAGSMLTTDVAVDILFFALLSPMAIFVLLKNPAFGGLLHQAGNFNVGSVVLGLFGLAVAGGFLVSRDWFQRGIERFAGCTRFGRHKRLPARVRAERWRAKTSLSQIFHSLTFLARHRWRALIVDFLLASVQWCCRYGLLPLILYCFGSPRNPLPLFLVQGLLFSLSLLVVLPGGGGTVEVAAALVLPQFVPVPLVGVVLLVWRFFSYHLYLLGGGGMFFWTCHRLNELFPGGTGDLDVLDLQDGVAGRS